MVEHLEQNDTIRVEANMVLVRWIEFLIFFGLDVASLHTDVAQDGLAQKTFDAFELDKKKKRSGLDELKDKRGGYYTYGLIWFLQDK